MQKIKYIEDNPDLGIEYDYNLIMKEFKKLKVPSDVWTPTHLPLYEANWHTVFSRRDTGKTTNVLLMAMLFNKEYGTITEYVRQTKEMIKASNIMTIFNTILKYDYVKKITKDYDSIYYHWGSFYFCNYDENGKVKSKSTTPFMYAHSIDKSMDLKSTYNNPVGDLIILDEFQHPSSREDEWLLFHHLISTIKRRRRCVKIILLGNTISQHNYYFREMGIERIVEKMKPHDKRYHTTTRGTRIYIEYAEPLTDKEKSEKQKVDINQYHGFDNLQSITGEGWDIINYPHITREIAEKMEYSGRFFVDANGYFMRCNLATTPDFGFFIAVVPTKNIPKDELTFVSGRDLKTKYECKGIGQTRQHKKLFAMFTIGRMLFSSNEVGELMELFIKENS